MQYRLKQLFKGLKKPLSTLNLLHFSHISARATAAKQELEHMQTVMLTSGLTFDSYTDVKRKTTLLLEAEQSFIAQKAKISYLKQGDRCTKFFHALIKRNNKKRAILAVQKTDGTTTMNPNEITHQFVNYYHDLLGRNVDRNHIDRAVIREGPCVENSQWQCLLDLVSKDEVRGALFDIDNDKAPGSDGFGSFFFKSS